MLGQQFYHETMRKVVVSFGTLFNNIQIVRKNSSGVITQSMKVPLAYGPQQKFLARLNNDPSLGAKVAVTLPRLGFEMTGITYDPTRKLTRIQKFKQVKSGKEGKVLDFNYTPVPYNISYNLYSFTASAEAGLQIIEQILPFFQPDFTVTINAIPDLDIKRGIPIVLNSVNYEDTYSGDFTTRRAVIYTLNFTAKTYLFGPSTSQKVIKTVQTDQYSDTDRVNKARESRIIVVPSPTTADADDDFGFTTTIDFFEDGKKYNVATDKDE